MKTSIVVLIGSIGAVAAAMVLASTPDSGTAGSPAKAPNRADVFAAATCGEPARTTVSEANSWHDALAGKRAQDRMLILASGNPAPAKGCDTVNE